MKTPNKIKHTVFLDDASGSSAKGIKRLLGGEPTLTVTISGVAGSGKTRFANFLRNGVLGMFEASKQGLLNPYQSQLRILIQTELPRKEVKKQMAKKPPMKETMKPKKK